MSGVTPSSRKRIIFGNDGIVTRTSSSQGFFPLKTAESKDQEAVVADPQVVEEYAMPSNLLATRSESPPPKAFQIKTKQHLRKNVVNHAHNQIVVLEQDDDSIIGERVTLKPY
jgi:hypothetical protein